MEHMSQGELFGPDHPSIETQAPEVQEEEKKPKSISEEMSEDDWVELSKKDPERYTDY